MYLISTTKTMHGKKAFIFLIMILIITACGSPRQTSNTSGDARIQKKYAGILEVSSNEISNLKLYKFIDGWIGVPYKYAGKSKGGVDCSGLSSIIRNNVYKNNIGGSSRYIYSLSHPVKKNQLEEGDFVFFKIKSKKISHMGIYLKNNKFIHASSSRGVTINDLNETYYKKYFYKGGRLK